MSTKYTYGVHILYTYTRTYKCVYRDTKNDRPEEPALRSVYVMYGPGVSLVCCNEVSTAKSDTFWPPTTKTCIQIMIYYTDHVKRVCTIESLRFSFFLFVKMTLQKTLQFKAFSQVVSTTSII